MNSWTADDLDRIGGAEEVRISSQRPDGSYRPYVIIWAVRAGDALFVRSAYGATNPWYRRALAAGAGRISAGGVERDATFETVGADETDMQAAIDGAYHSKYDRHGPQIVGTVVGPGAHLTTLRLVAA